jgi:hypothetical protein
MVRKCANNVHVVRADAGHTPSFNPPRLQPARCNSCRACSRRPSRGAPLRGRSSAWLHGASRGRQLPLRPRHGSMVGGRSKLQTPDPRPQTSDLRLRVRTIVFQFDLSGAPVETGTSSFREDGTHNPPGHDAFPPGTPNRGTV